MKRTFWKKVLTFALSAALAVSVGSVAFAEEPQSTQSSMTIKEFEAAVVAEGGTYDGNGVTITWSPSSGCFYGQSVHNCLFGDGKSKSPDGNTPDRIQSSYAQYQLFEDLGDVSISNVNFVCVQPESAIILCKNSGWQGTLDPATVKIMAEIQCKNTGNTSFTNCTFNNVTISPYGSGDGDTASFESCRFSNVDKYAIKDIYAQNATVNNCSFNDCNGAIYFEGSTEKGKLSITNNSFSNIAERGMIQFSANGIYSNANVEVTGNTGNVEVLFRELNDSIQSVIYDNPDLAFQKSKTDDSKKELLTASVGNKYYSSLNDAITAIGSQEATVTLGADCTENVEIPTGANITIDLNGHNITNKDNDTIKNKGNLTITGNGTVDNVTHGKAALYNDVGAVAVLNGGTYTRSKENGQSAVNNGGNSYYAILNHGTMEINAGVSVIQNGHYSSLLENGWQNGGQNKTEKPSKLTINGGTFVGGLNTIKNDDYGELLIVDGTFTSVSQAAFLNWNIAEVRGGVFDATEAKDAVILNGHINETMDKGILSISGGQFKGAAGKDCIVWMTGSGSKDIGTVKLSGGQFTSDVNAYCNPGYTTGNKKAIGSDYYQVHQHVTNLTATPAKAATCTEAGNKAYWECSVCGKLFTDAEAKNEISDATIAPTGHKLTKIATKEATCTEPGNVEYWHCDTCGKNYEDEKAIKELPNVGVPATGHNLKLVEAVAATTEKEGNLAYYVCQNDNNEWFWDAEGKNLIENHNSVLTAKLTSQTEELNSEVGKPEETFTVTAEGSAAPVAVKIDTDKLMENTADTMATVDTSVELKNKAVEELAKQNVTATAEEVTLILTPAVEVENVKVDEDKATITMYISLVCKVEAKAGDTVVPVAKETVPNDQIKQDTVITMSVPASWNGKSIIVRHETKDRGVKFYSAVAADDTVTFTVPAEDGFSPFTLFVDDGKTVTVKLDNETKTYNRTDVVNETALPAPSKFNYAFKGWKFEGVDGQHFNMTAELFEALLDKNAVVIGSSVFEGPMSEHPEIEEAKKNGTWGVDENKPAATAKPAAAAAVTPVRSSIPKTSDDSNLMLWVCLMGIAALGLGGAVYMKKRNHQ